MTDKTVASSKGETPASAGGAANKWYAVSADDVAQKLGVDPANGLSAAKVAELLKKDGPNALPAGTPASGFGVLSREEGHDHGERCFRG